jgi:hypothetical protein
VPGDLGDPGNELGGVLVDRVTAVLTVYLLASKTSE